MSTLLSSVSSGIYNLTRLTFIRILSEKGVFKVSIYTKEFLLKKVATRHFSANEVYNRVINEHPLSVVGYRTTTYTLLIEIFFLPGLKTKVQQL